jgi:hypothetical protein
MNKPLWLAGMTAAIAVPYMVIDGRMPEWAQNSRQQWFGAPTAATMEFQHSPSAINPTGVIAETPIVSLAEALRANINPQWIVARWPSVTTIVAEANLAGYRVPFISGFQGHDVVGSLTYYFDGTQRLQRISMLGNTRDERALTMLVAQQFGLQPEPTLQGGLFIARRSGQPHSALLIQFAPMLSVESAQPDRTVRLEWNATNSPLGLSWEMQEKISGR